MEYLAEAAQDPEIKKQSQYLLSHFWLDQLAWDKLMTAFKHWVLEDDFSLQQLASWVLVQAEVYAGFPPETYVFEADQVILPLKTNIFTGHPIIEVAISGKKYRFFMDTGAPTTLLSSRVAEEIGIQTAGSITIATSTSGAAADAEMATVDLMLDSISIKNHPVLVVDKEQMGKKILGISVFRVDGILGWNALQNITVTFDYPEKMLILQKPMPFTAQRRNLLWSDGYPVVALTDEQGRRLNFLLDTGCNQSKFFENLLTKVDDKEVRTKEIRTIGIGYTGKEEVLTLSDLVLVSGGWAWHFKNIVSMDSLNCFVKFDGLLGIDVLKKGRVTIDAVNGIFSFSVN